MVVVNIDIQISIIQMFSLVYINLHDLLCDGSPSTTHDEIRVSCLWTGKLCWAFSTNLLMIWECQNCRKRGHSHLLNLSFDYITPAKTQFNGQRWTQGDGYPGPRVHPKRRIARRPVAEFQGAPSIAQWTWYKWQVPCFQACEWQKTT